MAESKHICLWSFFSSPNSTDYDVSVRTVRFCGNTTKLDNHLRFNHNTDEAVVMQRQSCRREGAAWARQSSVTVCFSTGRFLPGTERVVTGTVSLKIKC